MRAPHREDRARELRLGRGEAARLAQLLPNVHGLPLLARLNLSQIILILIS